MRTLPKLCMCLLVLGGCQGHDSSDDGGSPGGEVVDPKLTSDADSSGSDSDTDSPAPLSRDGFLQDIAPIVRMEDSRRLSRPAFERLVTDTDPLVRHRAFLALGRLGRAEALGPLRTGLGDDHQTVRLTALFALGQIEAQAHHDAEELIFSFLDLSPSLSERREAIVALGQIGSEPAVPLFVEGLEAQDPLLRAEAARAIGVYVMRQRPPEPPPVPPLVPRLRDTDASVRVAAAFALSRGSQPSSQVSAAAIASLEDVLGSDPDPEVRIMAARALARLGINRPNTVLKAVRDDTDWRVRTVAGAALARKGPPAQVAQALNATWQRIALTKEPTGSTHPNPLGVLPGIIPSEGLLSADVHTFLGLLSPLETRRERGVKGSLARIHKNISKLYTKTEAREKLALSHLKCRVALVLDRLGPGRPRLVSRCRPEDQGDQKVISEPEARVLEARAWRGSGAVAALRSLRKLARHEESRVRLAAVEAAGTIESKGRLPLITKALRDKSPAVVAAAAHELYKAAPLFEAEQEPTEKLSITVHTDQGPILHAVKNEPPQVPDVPEKALAAALRGADPEKHVETVINLLKTIGRLKAKKAAELVVDLSRHHNAAIRTEARGAMEDLERDPGPEISLDPPNRVDLELLADLVSAEENPRVMLLTTAGPLTLELYAQAAPATVANFLSLVRDGFYNGVTFHRIVPGFVAQTGDPTATGFGGPGYTFRCEPSPAADYQRGSVGMALAGPDTGGSQFFIAYSSQPHLRRRYTLFGRVVIGLEVLDTLQPWDQILSATEEGSPQ